MSIGQLDGLNKAAKSIHGDFPLEHGDFPLNHGDFPLNHGDFPLKHGDFPIKHGDFPWLSKRLQGPIPPRATFGATFFSAVSTIRSARFPSRALSSLDLY